VLAPAQWIRVEDLPQELRTGEFAAESLSPSMTEGSPSPAAAATPAWLDGLEREVRARIARGEERVMDQLTREFETRVLACALSHVRGRRGEAATLLGMGRNTVTRKIKELRLEEGEE